MIGIDDSFPRGNRIKNTEEPVKRKFDDNLFTIAKAPKAKKARKEKTDDNETPKDQPWYTTLKLNGTLSYNKIQPGMLVLGCIKRVTNLSLQMELPGLTYTTITINFISEKFTENIKEKLQKEDSGGPGAILQGIFHQGELVPVKILINEVVENGHKIHASVNPADVNAEKGHASFVKGCTAWASVQDESDHGYELSVGVPNCRVFLPFKNVPEGVKYELGAPIYCAVHKAESSGALTTLTVSAKREHLDKVQLFGGVYLQNLIPGTKIKLLVEEVSADGVKGTFFENCFGYLDRSQLLGKLTLEEVQVADFLEVYVLYVEPITKITYFTARCFERALEATLPVGATRQCEVTQVRSSGVIIKIGKNLQGYVANKRLIKSVSKSESVESIHRLFPVKTKKTCRILEFNSMEQMYICTFEKELLKEKIFTVKDLTLGQKLSVKIDKILPNGFVVSAGLLHGFVPNIQISNAHFTENIKNKYAIGSTVPAKVLNITSDDNVLFTLKKGFLESDDCLGKLDDVVATTAFTGMVVATKLSGALVAFYGVLNGWLPSKRLNSGVFADPNEYFFIGQVVHVYVIDATNGRLVLSLTPKNAKLNRKIKVGFQYTAKVAGVDEEGVKVRLGRLGIDGRIPTAHLSHDLSMAKVLAKSYDVGDIIPDLICLSNNKSVPVVSKREYSHNYKNKKAKILKFADLKVGKTLRCSFENENKTGITVTTLLEDFHNEISISKKNLPKDWSYTEQELIFAKILEIDHDVKQIKLDAKIEKPKLRLEPTLDLFEVLLEEYKRVIEFGESHNCKIAKYRIGERVNCIVTEINSDGSCLVSLPNGSIGSVPANLSQAKLQTKEKAEGVVLFYNFLDDVVVVCLKNAIKNKINQVQDGIIKKTCNDSALIDILLDTSFFVIGVLRDGSCNRQLVYLPLDYTQTGENWKVKITIARVTGDFVVGIPKKVMKVLNKQEARMAKIGEKKKKTKKTKKTKKAKAAKVVEMEVEEPKEELESEESDSNRAAQISEEASDADVPESDEEMQETDDKIEESDEERQGTDDKIEESDEERQETDDKIEESDEELDEDSENEVKIEEPKPEKGEDFKLEEEEEEVKIKIEDSEDILLPGISSFYSTDDPIKEESSSDEENAENGEQKKKKKKLSSAERSEVLRLEEERINKIEKELADASTMPQSAEQFDRVLLANPNSSELWLKYIAMHVATTELEKARAVGKRALETINMTLVKEKFNVWVALLALENMYGTKESFERLFEDAVKYNDSLEVYLSVIQMFAQSGKINEMEEKIRKVRGKEKQNTKMWLDIGLVYYKLGDFKNARNIKEAALKSILDPKRQFDLIVKFGIMEFQNGDLQQAIANFEAILETYPSKTNIWIIYVDQLVKKDKIELARKLLEKAASEKFSLKSMKTFFHKYLSFEEKYGTEETVQAVKKRAEEYVQSVR